MKGGTIIQIFQDVDLRCSHDGLTDVAKKEKVNLSKLNEGEYVVFFNSKRTHLKIAAAHGTIAYRRSEHGRFFDVSCIVAVVRAFHNTGRLDYDAALKERLDELLKRRAHVSDN